MITPEQERLRRLLEGETTPEAVRRYQRVPIVEKSGYRFALTPEALFVLAT